MNMFSLNIIYRKREEERVKDPLLYYSKRQIERPEKHILQCSVLKFVCFFFYFLVYPLL